MAFTQTAAPAAEPLSLDDAKAYLRVDHGDDDTFISSLIVTSRLQVETALDLALIQQSWRWVGTVAPDRIVLLRPFPVLSVDAVARLDDGVAKPLLDDGFTVDASTRPATVRLQGLGLLQVQIDFTAGFGAAASDVPAPIRHALLQLVAHWYENREPVVFGQSVTRIPNAVSELLMPYRQARL
jgi:uncharacterized phiE125 gp8 family phage protein